MGLNDTVSAERVHISFFGMRNAGKSSLVNAVTGQELAVVSDVKGTTTDPVRKAMEILPLGPVVIIDTPGIDDEGELGEKRVQKARQVLTKTDIAVLVVDSTKGLGKFDNMMIDFFKDKKIPFVIAYNKSDLLENVPNAAKNEIYVSAKNDKNVYELKEKIASFCKMKQVGKDIVADVLEKGDTVILVIPIDESAPKGRVILPQQQVLRELLDNNCTAVCCQVTELDATIKNLVKRPKLVITDSQAFEQVSAIVPEDIGLTSFSILFARYKGDLKQLIDGARQLKKLEDGDTVLISEGCTHHRQCNDIGTVKLPNWIRKYSGKELNFEFTSGTEFPDDLSKYALVVHCGGCMLNETEMKYGMAHAVQEGVKIVETAGRIPSPKRIAAIKEIDFWMHKCTIVKHALKAQGAGCDMIVADGFECAGHPGENDIGSMVLTPAMIKNLKVPVVTAGGVSTGRQMAAALMLGAEGVYMGTRFLLTKECPVLDCVKEQIASSASEMDTILMLRSYKNTTRAYKTAMTESVVAREKEGKPFAEIQPDINGGEVRKMFFENGDVSNKAYICVGQSVGLVDSVVSVKDAIEDVMAECVETLRKFN